MKLRVVMTWKFPIFHLLLPALRRLGPARCDAVLGALGRLHAAAWPPRRRALDAALARARAALPGEVARRVTRADLAANALRFLARDYPLDGTGDAEALARFDVRGEEALHDALRRGRGAVLVGSHLGAHIAGVHWLIRRGIPLRLLVQRPRHVSSVLNGHFDARGPHPQPEFFLSRGLSPGMGAERLLRARAALREGLSVYLTGDIPWTGPNTRPGLLLGQSLRFLSVWTDLAVLTRSPAFAVFCTHRPGGRFALTIEPLGTPTAGGEDAAVARFLARLEAEIAAHPADAVAQLLWPCYGPPARPGSASAYRPSRHTAVPVPLEPRPQPRAATLA